MLSSVEVALSDRPSFNKGSDLSCLVGKFIKVVKFFNKNKEKELKGLNVNGDDVNKVLINKSSSLKMFSSRNAKKMNQKKKLIKKKEKN